VTSAVARSQVFVLDEADDMIENFAGECMFVKRAASQRRAPPQVSRRAQSHACEPPGSKPRSTLLPHPRLARAHNDRSSYLLAMPNPPQTLLFSASFECLEPSHPQAMRAKSFTDQVRRCGRLRWRGAESKQRCCILASFSQSSQSNAFTPTPPQSSLRLSLNRSSTAPYVSPSSSACCPWRACAWTT
jgi:hypothetical protein